MLPKRHIAYPIVFFLLLLLIGIGLFFLTSYILPGILESKLISVLKKDAGITDIEINFHELDLEGASLGSMRIGSPRNPALVIRSLHVEYSPEDLFQKKVKKIVASGVELYFQYKDGHLDLRGFDLKKFIAYLNSSNSERKTSEIHSYPFLPKRIEINNGTLVCISAGTTYRVPFEMDIVAAENAAHILKAAARLYPRGQALKISAHIDLKQNRIASQLNADKLNLARFADLFEPIEGLGISGLAGLEAKADFRLTPFSVSAISGRLTGFAIKARYKDLQIETLRGTPDNAIPLIIDVESSELQKWRLRLSDFATSAPLAARVSEMAATLQANGNRYNISGNFKLSFSSTTRLKHASAPIRLIKPFDLPVKVSAHYTQNGSWHFDLTNGGSNRSGLAVTAGEYEKLQIHAQFPAFHLTGDGTGGKISATYNLNVPDVHITWGDVNVLFPRFVLKGKTNMTADRASTLTSSFDLDMSGTRITVNTTEIKAGNLSFGGKLQRDKKRAHELDGIVSFANTRMDVDRRRMEIKQAQGNIPLKFPAENSGKTGSVSIAAVNYERQKLGAVKAEIRQTATGIAFSGKLINPFIAALSAKFSGESDFLSLDGHETRAEFELFYPETGPEIHLAKFIPAAEGFTFKGKLLEQGNLVIGKNRLDATVKSSLINGKLQHRKNKILIEGIQMTLLIPYFFQMHSAPDQKLTFARASLGDIHVENGEINFQIESARSLLIEKSHFNWCDGKVEAPAIRFKSGIEEYRLILYGNRLNLAKVLEQFGAASVEAQGELNGRIPIRYKNGQLSFHNGFLFTTPGEAGKIRMTDTEILTAGIPPDTPQYVQMELARKALEDYDYDWAKLNLNTEGEDLLLNLQLDGKPAKSLPFVYQKDIGGFAEVEAGIEGSTFQGIRLDINFRLPLNKLLQYKELIRMIQKSRE